MTCPYAYCLVFKGCYTHQLGRLEENRRLVEQGIRIAREQGDIEVVGYGRPWSMTRALGAGLLALSA